MVAVPNVERSTQAAGTIAITEAKLKVGTVAQQTSNTVAPGSVISQDPASGSSLAEGSPVNLVISSGPQMVTVPKGEVQRLLRRLQAIRVGTLSEPSDFFRTTDGDRAQRGGADSGRRDRSGHGDESHSGDHYPANQ
jgi:hypothetical protein